MKKLIVFLVCIGLVILDNSFMPFFSISGVYPSLLLIFAIAYSLLKERQDAVFVGVLSGVLQDVFFYNGFGVNSLINLFLCLIASFIGDIIVRNKRPIPILSMFFISIIKCFSLYIIFYCMHTKIKLNILDMIIVGIYNAILMFFFYKYVAKIIDRNNNSEKWRFR